MGDSSGAIQRLKSDRSLVLRGVAGKSVVGQRIDAAFWVSVLLSARVIRHAEATIQLLEKGFVTEAGIVALAAFEAKLDALFVGTDAERGDFWMAHTDPRHQPWPVWTKLDALYGRGNAERNRQGSIFSHLSAIKHGNPMTGAAGFPLRRSPELWDVNTGGFDDALQAAISDYVAIITSEQLLDCGLAACRIHQREGVLDSDFEAELQRRRPQVATDFALAVARILELEDPPSVT